VEQEALNIDAKNAASESIARVGVLHGLDAKNFAKIFRFSVASNL
jgi:hypothetical protein